MHAPNAHDTKRTLRVEFSRLNLPPRSNPPPLMRQANSRRNCGASTGCSVNRNIWGHQMNGKKYAAEFIGTFWLAFAGCGSAVISAAFPQVGIGLLGVSLAFG